MALTALQPEALRLSARPLLTRWADNPVLAATDLPFPATCVFNSGATVVGDEIVMLVNAWDEAWAPRFVVARSRDGIHFRIGTRNLARPPREYPYVAHEGIFDTRVTTIGTWHYVTWNVASHLGGRIMLARTRDFEALEECGFIAGPDHRNCALFPEKIGGYYCRLERPHGESAGDIYVSFSPDLEFWGRTSLLLEKNRRLWCSAKVGPGAPPLRTKAGWLVIFHGARQSMNGYTYTAGAMLLDLDDPTRVIGVMDECLLAPEAPCERTGHCPNVVFPTALLRHGPPGQLKLYYGAADTCMALAILDEEALIAACLP